MLSSYCFYFTLSTLSCCTATQLATFPPLLLSKEFPPGTLLFQWTHADHSVFTRNNMVILIYVDDILIFACFENDINLFKESLKKHFCFTDNGPVECYLGIEIIRTPGSIYLNQQGYINHCLNHFNMTGCHQQATPFNDKEPLHEAPADHVASQDEICNYQSQVGCLVWLSIST